MLGGAGEREYLACEQCGAVVVIAPDELDELRASVRERFGYEVAFADTPMVGRCRRCRTAG
jgi:Fur family ferric uptake transcriptional regulator